MARGKTGGAERAGEDAAGPAILCGVDEAGLGPILGPLTIGFSVLKVPHPRANPWSLLRKLVDRQPREGRPHRLVVADSKKVFARNPKGRRRLERTALTFLSLLDPAGRPPRDPHRVLFRAFPPPASVRDVPWYGRLPELPVEHDAAALELEAALLARALAGAGCTLLDAGVRLVPAVDLNASLRETDNKGRTVWLHFLEVLRRLWRDHGLEGPDVTVDMLGGRLYYGPELARDLPEASVRLVREDAHVRRYELTGRADERRMLVTFRAQGEDKSFAVALASCLAKYARETVMAGFNAYFADLLPDLRPTAGYRSDGERWLEDARAVLALARLGPDALVRIR